MRAKHLNEFAFAIARIADSPEEAVCAASVIQEVAKKYNPRYNHQKMLTAIIDYAIKLRKHWILDENKIS